MKNIFNKSTPYILGSLALIGFLLSSFAIGVFDLRYHVDVQGGGCQWGYGNPGYKPGDKVFMNGEDIVKYHTGKIAIVQNTGDFL